jgi:hypothetical protein
MLLGASLANVVRGGAFSSDSDEVFVNLVIKPGILGFWHPTRSDRLSKTAMRKDMVLHPFRTGRDWFAGHFRVGF